MALTPDYAHKNSTLLSKVKMTDGTYVYIKDADLRAIVEAFGNATAKDYSAAAISEATKNSADLPTVAQVYTFVTDSVKDLNGAMHFVEGTRETAEKKAGNVVIEGTKEYVYNGTAWVELGDEGLWVPNTRSIAGLKLDTDIQKAALQTALELNAFAYAATASATLNDYVTSITGATYTPAGSVNVESSEADANASLTSESYTPEGSVSGKVTATGTVSIAKDASGSFQPSGSNAASDVSITKVDATVLGSVKTAAVAPSFTEGEFTPASITKNDKTVATEGLVAAMGTGDDAETLVFAAAGTATATQITAFDGGSKDADSFSAGSAAEFNNATVIGSITKAEAAAQVFTGDTFAPSFAGNADGDAISASFTGTAKANAIVTGVSYKKTTVGDATFTGTEATITPTLVKINKTITVYPDAK